MNTNASNILSSLYGKTPSATSTTLSPTVAARVQQALQGQKGTIDKLNAGLTQDQTKLSGLGQLQSALAAFGALAEGIGGAGLATSATASAKGVLTAATGTGAKAGTYQVDVRQLAQHQVLNSATQPLADTKIGSGTPATVRIDIGTLTADGFKATGGSGKTITIDSSNNTLDGIAKALKEAGVDVAVVKGEGGYSLQVKGKDGAAQAIRIGVTGDAALKAAIGFDPAAPSGTGMQQAQAAQDALLTVDGKEIASASNSVGTAIAGTTLTLTAAGKTDVTVSQDTSQIGKNVAAFVQGYNDLTARLATLQAGALKGDATLGNISSQLSQMVKMGGGLADAGVTLDAKGQMVLDEKKLKAAIAADPSAVTKLFTNEGRGLADKLDKKIDAFSADGGALARSRTQVTRDYEQLTDRKEKLAKSLTVQAQALAQLYTMQEQSGGTGSLLDLLG
ncbi:flagellar filament capping protein FliD [Massilia sp. YMA4]|uniref:flagellar filament capping protein FliD n=1 Tax=Massilia sp. YMA4 TaxID=1593482 RepID=UPI000DD1319A|nr:flagellar filament capping protein FliD [Massilia sp. YMA4]AXA91469.1 flagellar hook 2 domain-containing protein [Massilia sp. YMA4]